MKAAPGDRGPRELLLCDRILFVGAGVPDSPRVILSEGSEGRIRNTGRGGFLGYCAPSE